MAAAMAFNGCDVTAPKLKSGDLIFVGVPAGDSPDSLFWIHTAIVDIDADGGAWVVEATLKRGVDLHPIDTFIHDFRRHDGSYPIFKVYRLKDDADAETYVLNARSFIGEAYDTQLEAGNGKHYCTELVYDSYIIGSEHIFSQGKLEFRDEEGNTTPYWDWIFSRIGKEAPAEGFGTSPQVMIKEDCLMPVDVDINPAAGF